MPIRHDYLMDMIVSFTQSIIRADESIHGGLSVKAMDSYEEVVGDILDMDASTVLELSPGSLVTMMQISAVDERLAVYMAYVLQRIAEIHDQEGDPLGDIRRQQARAVAEAYGFPIAQVPPEVQDYIEHQGSSLAEG